MSEDCTPAGGAADTLTVLHSAGPRLAKRWLADGTIEGYEDARQVRVSTVPVRDIATLSAALRALEDDPRACVVRGRFVGDAAARPLVEAELERDRRRGKSAERPRKGYTLRRASLFADAPSHVLIIDVDGYRPALHDPVTQAAEACEEYILEHLPAAFHGASFHWQLSGSAGHARPAGVLKAHIAFWLAQPLTGDVLTAWVDHEGLSRVIDRACLRVVQPIYTAAPVFDEGVADPVLAAAGAPGTAAAARSGLARGWAGDEVDLQVSTATLVAAARKRQEAAEGRSRSLVDPSAKEGLVGLFHRLFPVEDVLERWLAGIFTPVTDTRLTWEGGGGAAEGAFITEDRMHICNTHNTDPLENRAANLWDVVRTHLFGELDDGLERAERVLLGPGEWPSQRAMVAMVAALPEVAQARREQAQQQADGAVSTSQSRLSELLADIAAVGAESLNDLQHRIALDVAAAAAASALTDLDRAQVARASVERARALGAPVSITDVRRWLREAARAVGARAGQGGQAGEGGAVDSEALAAVAAAMPEWAREWVFVTNGDRFFNLSSKEDLTVTGFRARFNREMPLINMAGDRANADKLALDHWGTPVVTNKAYMPAAGPVFSMNGLQWANLYRPGSVPDALEAQTFADLEPEQRDAIDAVRTHLATFFRDERERGLFISWIAHNVQRPGVKIRWAPYIAGVPGDGKTFWADLLSATMGAVNVGSIGARVLESQFTDWAIGHAVIVLEEVKLHGHNRHDLANGLKPYVTNDAIGVHPKGRAPYTAPNTTNYLLFSNHLDGLPVDEADRRYMICKSSIAKAEVETLSRSGYFGVLFDAVRNHAAAIRWWLLRQPLHPEFAADGRAPWTQAKDTVVSITRSETETAILDALESGACGITPEVLSLTQLNVWLDLNGHPRLLRNGIAVLVKMGYRQLVKQRRWRQITAGNPDNRHTLFIREDLDWTIEQAIAHLDTQPLPGVEVAGSGKPPLETGRETAQKTPSSLSTSLCL